MDVSRQSVEARYHEFGFKLLAGGERGGGLWSVGSLTALNLNKFGGECPVTAIEKV